MAVFRIERTRDYTVMSNHHLRNANLSLKAKGLLSMMLSLPEDWNYTTRGLAKICKEGVDAIGAALRELEAAGYIVRHKLRDRQGRISDTEYVIYEQPQLRKEDIKLVEQSKAWVLSPERKASKKEVEYAVKRLDGVIGRITNAMKSTIQKIQTTLMKPEVKKAGTEQIKKKAKSSIIEQLSRKKKEMAEREVSRTIPAKSKKQDMEL